MGFRQHMKKCVQKQHAYIMSKNLHHINEQPAFFGPLGDWAVLPAGFCEAAVFGGAAGFGGAGPVLFCGAVSSLFLSKVFKALSNCGVI